MGVWLRDAHHHQRNEGAAWASCGGVWVPVIFHRLYAKTSLSMQIQPI